MSKSKKQEQLGMNPSTASNRLVKDILFFFVQNNDIKCYHCNKEMSREDFSIEHIKPWLDSEDPVKLYFDLNNISFSHLKCNREAARPRKHRHPSRKAYEVHGCRCDECKTIQRDRRRNQRLK